MQIKGKIIHILPIQSGRSKKGDWQKRDIVIETDGEYPKKVSVSIWNKLLDIPIKEGIEVNAEIDINAKEYNGKWYNEVKAWKLEVEKFDNKVTNSKKIVTNIIDDLTEENLPF